MKKYLIPASAILSGLVAWQLLPGLTAKLVTAGALLVIAVAYLVRGKRDARNRAGSLLLTFALLSGSLAPAAQPAAQEVPQVQTAEIGWGMWFVFAVGAGLFYDGIKWLAGEWWDQPGVGYPYPASEGAGMKVRERPPPPTCLVAGRNRYTGCVDP